MAKVSGMVLVLKDIGQGHHDSARCLDGWGIFVNFGVKNTFFMSPRVCREEEPEVGTKKV